MTQCDYYSSKNDLLLPTVDRDLYRNTLLFGVMFAGKGAGLNCCYYL